MYSAESDLQKRHCLCFHANLSKRKVFVMQYLEKNRKETLQFLKNIRGGDICRNNVSLMHMLTSGFM